jgi:hypothetical protein
MGFDPSNITPKDIRIDEYYRTEEKHKGQDEHILLIFSLHKGKPISASGIYLYLKQTNNGTEKYPLTSIRRSINTLFETNKIRFVKKDKSKLYDSNESYYQFKEYQEGLF